MQFDPTTLTTVRIRTPQAIDAEIAELELQLEASTAARNDVADRISTGGIVEAGRGAYCVDRESCVKRQNDREYGSWRPVPIIVKSVMDKATGQPNPLQTYCVRCGKHVPGGLFVENVRVKGHSISWVVDHPDRHGCTMRPREDSPAVPATAAPTVRDIKPSDVPCPNCGSTAKRCKRPSGHDAMQWHVEREDAAALLCDCETCDRWLQRRGISRHATVTPPAPIHADSELTLDWAEAVGGLQAEAFPEMRPKNPDTGRVKPVQTALF